MTHEEKIGWMAIWAAKNGFQLILEGEVGFGRQCVGILVESHYPDYEWHNEEYERIDNNGKVWIPKDAYHKHPCVAVLGRGEEAEAQLYQWLQWLDDHGFKLETGDVTPDPKIPLEIVLLMGSHRYARMVRKENANDPRRSED